MEIRNVGVVGCGQMGGGIVQVCAQAGYEVIVSEASGELLDKGLARVTSFLERGVASGRLAEADKAAALSRIRGTLALTDLSGCDIVIEAAAENTVLKQDIFRRLDSICPSHTLLATNTSCLSVTDIGAVTARPDRVLGLHFFNPVPVMELIELIITSATSAATIEAAKTFAGTLGKKAVTVKDEAGFIVNRLMTPQILTAIRMVEDGIASEEDIDTGMKLGLNVPLGPLALADLIGLDIVLAMADTMRERLGEEQYAAPQTLKNKVSAGELGRKTGRGFFAYA